MAAITQRGLAHRWLYAAKPGSWPKLLVPLWLGQALGVGAAGGVRSTGVVVGLGFTLFGLLFIVLLNDWGDRRIDALKRSMFPEGCSPKTIPDGILPAGALLAAGLVAGAGCLGFAWLGAWLLQRPALGWLGVLGMLIFASYTLPPARLNYRGGGELLEMLGVGCVLPLFNTLTQGPWPGVAALWPLPGFTLLSLASAIASGLSDEQSDRQGGKTTFVTRFGNPAARRAISVLVPLAAIAWLVAAVALGGPVPWVLLVIAWLWHDFRRMRRHADAAVTNRFAAQARYKGYLHRAIWQPTAAIALWQAAAGLWPQAHAVWEVLP